MSRESENGRAVAFSSGKKNSLLDADRLQKILFDGTSRLTNRFPEAGAGLLDFVIPPLVANRALAALFNRRNRKIVRSLGSFRRFLVIPDIHIGDSVMSQAAITALRDFFPEAQVDFVVNRAAHPLIEGNPEITRVWPFFSGGSFPTAENIRALRGLLKRQAYDLCLNFSPYIKDRDIAPDGQGILNIMSHTPVIVGNERRPSRTNHFLYHHYKFVADLLSIVARPVRVDRFKGVGLAFSDSAVEGARRFASQAGLSANEPVILLNPDAASPFTRVPFDKQSALLNCLVRLEARLLLGEGHTEAGIGERLKRSLPLPLRSKVNIVPPDLNLETYSALLDFCDLFISGDTGPMHLAAARKYSRSRRFVFRNRTAVLCIFGATPARMSGYDSLQPGYLPANQDAPSWSYTAGSPCRNITCLNKMYKTCRTVRCFEEFDIEGLVARIESHLRALAGQIPLRREPATA